MVVATGHVSPEEHLVLVAEAHRRGIHRMVISQVRDEIPLEDRKHMAKQGAAVELVYRAGQDARPLIEAARAVGVQHCAITVDGGQAFGPVPAEASSFRRATPISWDDAGRSEDDGADSSGEGVGS
jgi:hypothetical protein